MIVVFVAIKKNCNRLKLLGKILVCWMWVFLIIRLSNCFYFSIEGLWFLDRDGIFDWSRKFPLFPQPIRSKLKTNYEYCDLCFTALKISLVSRFWNFIGSLLYFLHFWLAVKSHVNALIAIARKMVVCKHDMGQTRSVSFYFTYLVDSLGPQYSYRQP